jgi:hypothetical protein
MCKVEGASACRSSSASALCGFGALRLRRAKGRLVVGSGSCRSQPDGIVTVVWSLSTPTRWIVESTKGMSPKTAGVKQYRATSLQLSTGKAGADSAEPLTPAWAPSHGRRDADADADGVFEALAHCGSCFTASMQAALLGGSRVAYVVRGMSSPGESGMALGRQEVCRPPEGMSRPVGAYLWRLSGHGFPFHCCRSPCR